jgi:hypothetical protein
MQTRRIMDSYTALPVSLTSSKLLAWSDYIIPCPSLVVVSMTDAAELRLASTRTDFS